MIFYKARAMPEIWENKKRRGREPKIWKRTKDFMQRGGGKGLGREEGGSDPNSHSRRLKKSSMRRRYHFAFSTVSNYLLRTDCTVKTIGLILTAILQDMVYLSATMYYPLNTTNRTMDTSFVLS